MTAKTTTGAQRGGVPRADFEGLYSTVSDDYLCELRIVARRFRVRLSTVVMLAREKRGELAPYYPERNQHVRPRRAWDCDATQHQDRYFDISWAIA